MRERYVIDNWSDKTNMRKALTLLNVFGPSELVATCVRLFRFSSYSGRSGKWEEIIQDR